MGIQESDRDAVGIKQARRCRHFAQNKLEFDNPLPSLIKLHGPRVIAQDDNVEESQLAEVVTNFFGNSPFTADALDRARADDLSSNLFGRTLGVKGTNLLIADGILQDGCEDTRVGSLMSAKMKAR